VTASNIECVQHPLVGVRGDVLRGCGEEAPRPIDGGVLPSRRIVPKNMMIEGDGGILLARSQVEHFR